VSPIIFALIAFFGWAVGDIFGTVVTRRIGAYSTTLWSLVFSFAVLSLYVPFAQDSLGELTLGLFTLIIILGIIANIGFVAFNEALRVGSAPVVGTIAASFAAFAALLSLVFLGERVNVQQGLAIITIFVGVVFCSMDLAELRAKRILKGRGVLLAIVTMVCWGIYFAFIKIPINKIGWFWPSYLTYLIFPLYLLFVKFRKIKLVGPNFKGALPALLTAIVLLRIAEFSYNIGISRGGQTSIIAPIAGSYPALFVVLAFLVFKDPIKKQQILGIITTIAGIILLSIFSA